jgi:guanylate kinase
MTVVYVISAPSGSGKSTLVGRLLQHDPRLLFSISYTTRLPRGNEKPGQHYHYISRDEFETRIKRDEFLEWAQVFENYYGTHRSYLDRAEAEDRDLVLDIDVQGARQLKEKIPDAVSIFILPPSRQILEQRLCARSEDSSAVIERRLREAAEEIRHWGQYDYVLVNQEVETAAGRLRSIFEAERLRRSRVEESIQPILESFGASLLEPSRKPEKK